MVGGCAAVGIMWGVIWGRIEREDRGRFIDATKACLSFIVSVLIGLLLLYLLLHPDVPTLPLILLYDSVRSMTRLYFFGPYAAKCNGRKWFQCSMSLDVFWGTFQALFIQFDGTLTAIIGCVVGKFFGILWRYHSGTDRVCVVFEKIYESTAQKFSRVSPLPMTNADLPPQRLTDLPKLPKPPPLRKAASLDTILVSNSATFHQNHPPRNSFIYIPYLFPEQRSHLLLLDLTSTLVTSLTTRIHIFLLTLLPTESNFPAPNKYYLLMILVDIVSLLTLCVTYKAGVSGSKLVEFAFCNDVKFWVICSAAITMFVYSVGEPHHGFVF